MKIAGFNFTKISIEKFPNKLENLKINTKIDISKIDIVDSDLINSNETFVSINFNYEVLYDTQIAKIDIGGKVVVVLDIEKAKEIVKQWQEKKLPDDFKHDLFNFIMKIGRASCRERV